MWNSLPNDVVEADIINTFKNCLFNFNAYVIGTESLLICM